MKPVMLLPMAVLLTASVCGTRERPEPVLIPTTVYCVTGDIPDEPPRVQDELTGDSGVDIGIIAGSAISLRAWGRALKGMLEACRRPQ
jgi:hypothetical protein